MSSFFGTVAAESFERLSVVSASASIILQSCSATMPLARRRHSLKVERYGLASGEEGLKFGFSVCAL